MSLIATGGPAAPPLNDVLPNSAWWPAVSFAAYRAASRIDRTASDPQAYARLREAIGSVNAQLAGWLSLCTAADPAVQALTDLPNPPHQPEGWHTERYLSAVYNTADALIAEAFRRIDATGEGDRRADAMESPIDSYRRDAQYAIADLTGKRRRVVELL